MTGDPTATPDDDRGIRPETDRLLLDVMLGKLAVYLRVCGYDTAYALGRGLEAQLAELRAAGSSRFRRGRTRPSTPPTHGKSTAGAVARANSCSGWAATTSE